MKAAGITDEGIALVELLVQVLDENWPTRQQFIDFVRSKFNVPLDRRALSKQLGSPAKPNGPDWYVADLIVKQSAPEQQVQAVLARAAALYYAAREEHPPGYEGELGRISAADRAQLEELEKALVQRGDEVEALYAQVATLTAQGLHREEALRQLAENNVALISQVDTQEAEITRLTGAVMNVSSQNHQQLAQIEDQQRQLDEAEQRVQKQQRQAEVVALRLRVLRDMYAQLVAQQEVTNPVPSLLPTPRGPSTTNSRPWMPWKLTRNRPELLSPVPDAPSASASEAQLRARLDPRATPAQRRLALYLLVHQEFSGQGLAQLAAVVGLSSIHLDAILSARMPPTAAQVDALAAALEADHIHAGSLHQEAIRSSPPGDANAADQTPPAFPRARTHVNAIAPGRIGAYESIVAGLSRDVPAFVASSPGDSDTGGGDSGDGAATSGQTLSPARGDNRVTGGCDKDLRPICVEATAPNAGDESKSTRALYQSRSYQRHRRNRWILRSVIAAGVVTMSAAFTALTLVLAHPAAAATISWRIFVACLGCWVIAGGVRAVVGRIRGNYTARHRPGRQSPTGAVIAVASLPHPVNLEPEDGRAQAAGSTSVTAVDQEPATIPLPWMPVDLDADPPQERAPGARPSQRSRWTWAPFSDEPGVGIEPSPDSDTATGSRQDTGPEVLTDG